MNKYIEFNAKWLKCYDTSVEKDKIYCLLKTLYPETYGIKNIIDIGCGNGRFTVLLSKMFPQSIITGIDINGEIIEYAKAVNMLDNINYIKCDAFDFFNDNTDAIKYDLVFFSWSLFDMVSSFNQEEKYNQLDILIEKIKRKMSLNASIIVTQPTKGGSFERLLSEFMPNSDEDYYITHKYLIDAGFLGPCEAVPSINEPLTIWSNFKSSVEELYSGVSSIIMLETRQKLKKKQFNRVFERFIESCIINNNIELSDCVNIYYWIQKLEN